MFRHFRRVGFAPRIALWIAAAAWFAAGPAGAAEGAPPPPAQDLSPAEALHNLSLVAQKLASHAKARDLEPVLSYDFIFMKSFQFLLYRPALALPEKRESVKSDLVRFSGAVNGIRNAARDGDAALALARLDALAQAWAGVRECYPEDLMRGLSELSARYACPVHPEVIGRREETCPRCFRSLQLSDQFCGLPSADPVLQAAVTLQSPLVAGGESRAVLRLARKSGGPVGESDLLPTHTRRIHVFLIDATLTDYHHLHPEPSGNPGEFGFAFTPRLPGGYRLWADLLPAMTLREEMPSLDLGLVPSSLAARTVSDRCTNSGWGLRVVLPHPQLKAGVPGWARLVVTDSGGQPCAKLEPVMGNFAHFAAFHEDLRTLYHLHAAGLKDIVDPGVRGGPEVQTYLPGFKSGYIRMFAQVQIEGRLITAPFGFQVQP